MPKWLLLKLTGVSLMSSSISARPLQLHLPKPRVPVDVSQFGIDPGDMARVAQGEISDRQARINFESRKIFNDNSLNRFDKADRIANLRGNNGDGTSNIRFQTAAEAAEFAQVTQQRLTDSYQMIEDGKKLLAQIDMYRTTQGDSVADQLKAMAEGTIRNGYGGIESYTLALQENFNVSGTITQELPDGQGYAPGSFALSYEGAGFSALLNSPDYPAPARKEDASPITLVQVLDGVVREWTDRTRPGRGVDRAA
jgi:hypothetical protein